MVVSIEICWTSHKTNVLHATAVRSTLYLPKIAKYNIIKKFSTQTFLFLYKTQYGLKYIPSIFIPPLLPDNNVCVRPRWTFPQILLIHIRTIFSQTSLGVSSTLLLYPFHFSGPLTLHGVYETAAIPTSPCNSLLNSFFCLPENYYCQTQHYRLLSIYYWTVSVWHLRRVK